MDVVNEATSEPQTAHNITELDVWLTLLGSDTVETFPAFLHGLLFDFSFFR
jgi:hypothetical protein